MFLIFFYGSDDIMEQLLLLSKRDKNILNWMGVDGGDQVWRCCHVSYVTGASN